MPNFHETFTKSTCMFANSKNSSREGSKHHMNGLGKHKSLQGPLDQPLTIYKYAYAYIHARRSFLLFFLEDRVRRRGFSLTSQILNASASHTQDSPTPPPKIPAHIRARAENGKPTQPLLSELDTNWQCQRTSQRCFADWHKQYIMEPWDLPPISNSGSISRPLRAIVK